MQFRQFKSLLGVVALSSFAVAPLAQTTDGATPYTSAGATFRCGGVGDASQEQLKSMAGQHDAMLTFAAKDGAYVAGVDVRIARRGGADVLRVSCDGPLMLVNVPDGTYDITASFKGETRTRTVTLGKRHLGVHFTWPRAQG